jgi:predicted MPP superfamily phosphohydrolase
MQGGPGKFVFIILLILFVIDIYAFRGLRYISAEWNVNVKITLTIVYWLVPVFIGIMTFVIIRKMPELNSGKLYYRTFYTFMGVMILFYVPKLIFSAFELGNDLSNGIVFLINKINTGNQIQNIQVFRYAGAFIASFLFFFTFYGIVHGKYHYKVNQVSIASENVPKAFDGFKIVHISDWHIGSFYGKPQRIQSAVDRINALEPDIILFTGDLVNNVAKEVEEFIDQLSQLKAKHGVYSVLGNHDYGDYVRWRSKEEAVDNLKYLKDIQKQVGFKMLNNSSISIEEKGETISILGVENWGMPPFPQYGNLDTAMHNLNGSPFKILMSHDPTHWDAEVLEKTDIDLTLSGHTHGMQFGINHKSMKWSPVKLKYPRWGGLYKENDQQLFVSVGIGFIGFPGRVGVRPEIALLTLKRI